jgi:hypothetical protein
MQAGSAHDAEGAYAGFQGMGIPARRHYDLRSDAYQIKNVAADVPVRP